MLSVEQTCCWFNKGDGGLFIEKMFKAFLHTMLLTLAKKLLEDRSLRLEVCLLGHCVPQRFSSSSSRMAYYWGTTWLQRKENVFAMIEQLGKPMFFLTLGMSELHDEHLLDVTERVEGLVEVHSHRVDAKCFANFNYYSTPDLHIFLFRRVEQTVQRFLDVAKQMESFFLQKRLVLSAQKSEQMVMEDNTELKNELVRKEQLLQKYNEKIHYWQSLLNDTVNASGQQTQPQPQVPPGGGTQQGMPTQSQQSMPMGGVAQGLPGPTGLLGADHIQHWHARSQAMKTRGTPK
ncbi:hypothetical protein HPB49_013238 [Dermacentor silvarum]|uniref:Uncharacterized protein n=1 Tax=Dermacentor silvarum TaxID=543639 RepID=A0ACB8D5V9_DERSI|nr:hypothetical protein HPB49_013238 [Dermacentor silvarum]